MLLGMLRDVRLVRLGMAIVPKERLCFCAIHRTGAIDSGLSERMEWVPLGTLSQEPRYLMLFLDKNL